VRVSGLPSRSSFGEGQCHSGKTGREPTVESSGSTTSRPNKTAENLEFARRLEVLIGRKGKALKLSIYLIVECKVNF
jgi:hypothetical protein